MPVHLGGEGPNDLGSRSGAPEYQNDDRPGVVQTLLRRVQQDGWKVVGATSWRDIRKLRARGPTPAEEQNVLGLVLEAHRGGAEVVAFVRDADDDSGRVAVIDAAIARARADFPGLEPIGGVAVPVLEGWILALLGEHRTERLGKVAAQRRLVSRGVPEKNTEAMVSIAEAASLDRVPADARTIADWLKRAREVLPAAVDRRRSMR